MDSIYEALQSGNVSSTISTISGSSTGICSSLPCSERCEYWDSTLSEGVTAYEHMCSGLIDYSFYIPENVTQVMWSEIVNLMGEGYDAALDSTCLASIKKDICAKMYLPCENITIADKTTWNYAPLYEGGVSTLPYHRPCRSTCEEVAESCGIPGELLGAIPDCDEVSSVTGVGVYSRNSSECTSSLTTLLVQVASASEPYLYSSDPFSTCGHMIDEVFTGVSDPLSLSRPFLVQDELSVRPRVAPLQAPYVVQYYTELFLEFMWSLGKVTPMTRHSNCVEADRMFFCSTAYTQAQHQTHMVNMLPDFYLPQQASFEVCEQVVHECESHSFNTISLASYVLGFGAEISPLRAYNDHCSVIDNATNFSWYAKRNESIVIDQIGNLTRSPHIVKHPPTKSYFNDSVNICDYYFGINHPLVDESQVPDLSDPYADPAAGMPETWYGRRALKRSIFFYHPWRYRVCPDGWGETNSDCPYSYDNHHAASQCFKSCYHLSNLIDPMRKKDADEKVDALDISLLWVCFILMTYMVLTWLCFKKKQRERVVLLLSALMWLKTVLELYGYWYYKPFDRYCVNKVVPQHHGLNYCAISAMLKLGVIQPMFLCLVMFLALEIYIVRVDKSENVIYNKVRHWYACEVSWIFYLVFAFTSAVCFKLVPVFLIGQVAGFDGVNSCGYIYHILEPYSAGSPTPISYINKNYETNYYIIMMMNLLDYSFMLISVIIFTRITWILLKSYWRRNRVGVLPEGEADNENTEGRPSTVTLEEDQSEDSNESDSSEDSDEVSEMASDGEARRGSTGRHRHRTTSNPISSSDNKSAFIFTLAQANVLKTPMLIAIFSLITIVFQFYFWEVIVTDNKMNQVKEGSRIKLNHYDLISLWNQFQLGSEGPKLVYFTLDVFDSFFTSARFYYKVFDHLGFPLLLFIVFGLHPENYGLWQQFILQNFLLESRAYSTSSWSGPLEQVENSIKIIAYRAGRLLTPVQENDDMNEFEARGYINRKRDISLNRTIPFPMRARQLFKSMEIRECEDQQLSNRKGINESSMKNDAGSSQSGGRSTNRSSINTGLLMHGPLRKPIHSKPKSRKQVRINPEEVVIE